MADYSLLNIDADVIAHIFSIIIMDSFFDFANIFWVWHRSQSLREIKTVLEKIDWDMIFELERDPNQFVRERFNNFIATCIEVDILPAKFYIFCKKLFQVKEVQESLSTLQQQALTDIRSHFAYLVFKAIYKSYETHVTVNEMADLVKRTEISSKLASFIILLQSFNNSEDEKLLPRNKLCSKARNTEPLNYKNWPFTAKEVWYSLCHETVDEEYLDTCGIIAKPLTMDHILRTSCPSCSLQIILFKIINGGYLYY